MSLGVKTIVNELAGYRGYDLHWTVRTAAEVGAPQQRKRWFLLATRPGVKMPVLSTGLTSTRHWVKEPCPRFVWRSSVPTGEVRKRYHLLANTVVPHVVRNAFVELVAMSQSSMAGTVVKPGSMTKLPPCMVVRNRRLYACTQAPWPPPPRNSFEVTYTRDGETVTRDTVPTPTTALLRTAGVDENLLRRNKSCLVNVMLHSREAYQFVSRRGGVPRSVALINPAWVEWLQGYSPGWTLT